MLDSDECYAILEHRDPGADGRFFVAVKTTRIYCRPICPARVPLRRNTLFFRHAAEAQAAGFRPCLRCRPESAPDSPAWVGSLASINRALALIEEGALVEGSVEDLADRLGMTDRHLRRLFEKHLGIGPVMVEQARRVHLAKKLIHETSLSMADVAFAAGYGSVRRFNETFRDMFGRPPSSLRRAGADPSRPGIAVSLACGARGMPLERDCLRGVLDLGEMKVGFELSRATPTTLTLRFEDVPVRLLGKAIARIKRAREDDLLRVVGARPGDLHVAP
jgi:AraC family transcriptional regulator of adaptative response / DNA-3-methyladenine glycosylase II